MAAVKLKIALSIGGLPRFGFSEGVSPPVVLDACGFGGGRAETGTGREGTGIGREGTGTGRIEEREGS